MTSLFSNFSKRYEPQATGGVTLFKSAYETKFFGNFLIVLSEKALETEKNNFYHLSISFSVPEL